MVKHIVLFKLQENLSNEERITVFKAFKAAIEALPTTIDFIRKVEVGHNINANEKFDIALYSEFDSLDDVKRYAVHPDHVAAAKLLAGKVDVRSCCDYEF